ncbi:MAG: aminotransferase class III-fold pyridoxal phosphate-dependent enzyme [Acidimicrobiales bacterium]|nr:aminotransferase class III-fold pyridoxal phosphate-dependent enzyme [Acidimicrobiales bacterium]
MTDDLATASVPHLTTDLPGPKAREWIARDAAVASPSMARVYDLVPARGAGCTIEDVDGNRFLDFNAGIAVTATGHCHPAVVEAIERQARDLIHYCGSDWAMPGYTEVCERLAASAPWDGASRVFLANSGTEAVEGAIKLARAATGRPNVIAFLGAFHGRSLGSLSLTASKAHYRGGFGPLQAGVYHAPYGVSGYIEDVIFRHLTVPEDVAAIVVEPLQGEGGYLVPPPGWLAELRDVCDRHGIVLVADEVQSGVGRTGTMWTIEQDDVAPDVLLTGKGLASGLPLAAVVGRADLFTWGAGRHGSTFGGNAVACAAALATLDLVEGGLAEHAAKGGAQIMERLRTVRADHPDTVVDVRGRGLMIGIELPDHDAAEALEQACFRAGLLVLTCGPAAVRLAPPLVVTPEQADLAVDLLAGALATL